MQCDNYFCIYWVDAQCVLEEISLDIQGTCRECIYITLPDQTLQEARYQILRRLEET